MRRLPLPVAAVAALIAAGPAPAADAPGPAFVDEIGSQIQPLRSTGPGEIADARDSGVAIEGRRVAVDIYVSGGLGGAKEALRALGMDVAATATDPRPVVEGLLPLDSIAEAAKLGATDSVIPVLGGGTDAGSATSEGVATHNIPAAISSAPGADGAGIDVGVISDSIDTLAGGVNDSQASGDLPPDPRVVVLDDDTGSGTIDEGRAMAEIVYDEAPGLSRILFSTGTEAGPVGKAASINSLVANGADVITDDIFYLSEPFFQDGVVSQAVDAAKAAGVPYFASAGNRARQSYESQFRSGGGGLHDFDPGASSDTRSCYSQPIPGAAPPSSNAFILLALGWDEPVGSVTTDLDLRITDPSGTPIGTPGTTDNVTTGDPKEIAVFVNNTALPVTPCVEIVRASGSGSPFIKWIEQDNYTQGIPQFDTQSDTINPDAASAQGSLAVAAVNHADPGLDTPEGFSSRGPKTRLFSAAGSPFATPLVLNKPELAAADRVSTTVPGFETFVGTSAASPSAAGIAAVLLSANPDASVNEIYAQMTDPANTIECTSSSLIPDPDCGAGFILADRAIAALDKTGVIPSAGFDPAAPNGRQGWFTTEGVGVSWTTTDPESPTESTDGCDPIQVTGQGSFEFTCTAISGGGPGATTTTVRHDSVKPDKPKIKGFKGKGPLPAKKKIKCKSKDATSGLESCKISGYNTKPGKHKLKATAVDEAGLKSKTTLSYRVG